MEISKLMLTILTCSFLSSLTMARALPDGLRLEARLQGDNVYQCWESLSELRACTGEVVLFFLNGETYLGPSCCRAIRVIEHQCWPTMLGSLGFTAEEGDILRGYCDATHSVPPPPAPPVKGPTAGPGTTHNLVGAGVSAELVP